MCFATSRCFRPPRGVEYNNPDMSKRLTQNVTRRQVLEAMGIGAAAAALPNGLFAQEPTFPKGAIIRTLLKDYAPEDLAGGATLFHEHMQLGTDFNAKFGAASAAVRAANGLPLAPARGGGGGRARAGDRFASPASAGRHRDVDLMAEEVAKTKAAGVACIVDAGHPDMGRDIDFIRQVSMKSGVPIVAGGGFYTQPFYPKEISTMSEEQIVKALIKQADDNTMGVFGEIGSWDEMTADERKVFRAVGKAHVATNLSIFTHTGIPGGGRSSNSTFWKTPALSPTAWSSGIWEIWWTRMSMCTNKSAGAARMSVSIGRADSTMRSRCRS